MHTHDMVQSENDGLPRVQPSLALTPELRRSLEKQKQQLRLQEDAIDQLLAAAPAVSASAAGTSSSSLGPHTNLAGTASQRKRALDKATASPSVLNDLRSACPVKQINPIIAQPARRRNVSFGTQQQPVNAAPSLHCSFDGAMNEQYAASFPSAGHHLGTVQTALTPLDFAEWSTNDFSIEANSKRSRLDSSSGRNIYLSSTAERYNYQMGSSHLIDRDTISPDLLSTSFSTQPSVLSSNSAPILSRRSSTAGYSVLGDGMDMMRLRSVTSCTQSQPESETFPEQFLLEDLDVEHTPIAAAAAEPSVVHTAPIWSSKRNDVSTTVPDSSVALTMFSDGDVLDQVGTKFFSYNATEQARPNNQTSSAIALQHGHTVSPYALAMKRTSTSSSNGSNASTMSAMNRNGSERSRRQVQSAGQVIKSRAMAHNRAADQSRDDGTSRSAKRPILKIPYQRPKQQKRYCTQCNATPEGFHGPHELRRHEERVHRAERTAWICTTPQSLLSGDWPARPLSKCKQCQDQKMYNAYYNAAAHLRRAHFNPRKRGRRPKGEIQERRAGKTGGDSPSIHWLKDNGWLRAVVVTAAEWNKLVVAQDSQADDAEQYLEADETQVDVCTEPFDGLADMSGDINTPFLGQAVASSSRTTSILPAPDDWEDDTWQLDLAQVEFGEDCVLDDVDLAHQLSMRDFDESDQADLGL